MILYKCLCYLKELSALSCIAEGPAEGVFIGIHPIHLTKRSVDRNPIFEHW